MHIRARASLRYQHTDGCGLNMVYDLTMNIWRRNGRLTGAGRLCQREIAHQVYCEPLPLFRASTVGIPSRSARFITSLSSTSRGRQAEKAQKYPLRLHPHTMIQQSTSCWIRRCNRQYIFPRSSLSSATDRRELSLSTASAAAGPEPRGADDRPNSLEKKGQPRAELFPTEKMLTMNALHSLENRARVLFAQTHNA